MFQPAPQWKTAFSILCLLQGDRHPDSKGCHLAKVLREDLSLLREYTGDQQQGGAGNKYYRSRDLSYCCITVPVNLIGWSIGSGLLSGLQEAFRSDDEDICKDRGVTERSNFRIPGL